MNSGFFKEKNLRIIITSDKYECISELGRFLEKNGIDIVDMN